MANDVLNGLPEISPSHNGMPPDLAAYTVTVFLRRTIPLCGPWSLSLGFESARAYHSFQYFREFSPESDRNFTCNSSPVNGERTTVRNPKAAWLCQRLEGAERE